MRQVESAVRGDQDLGDADPVGVDDTSGEASDDRSGVGIDGAGLTPATKLRPPGLLELENLLADHLETSVKVQMGAKRGRVTVDFADLEDLERLYRLMAN